MIVMKKALGRRTVLKGLGAAISLPLLDAMTPAFAQSAVAGGAPVRLAWFYVPNGIDMRHWTPAAEGALGELPGILQPLAAHKNDLLVLSNLTSGQSGAYSVAVSNTYGGVVSSEALLSAVDSVPIIVTRPVSRGGYPNGSASFSVVAAM